MPSKLENVGIAVRDLEATIAFFTEAEYGSMATQPWVTGSVPVTDQPADLGQAGSEFSSAWGAG